MFSWPQLSRARAVPSQGRARTKRRPRALLAWHCRAVRSGQAEGCPRRPAGTASPLGTWRAAHSAIDPPGRSSEVHGTACSRSGRGGRGPGNRSSFPFGNARARRFQELANPGPKLRQSWGRGSLQDREHRDPALHMGAGVGVAVAEAGPDLGVSWSHCIRSERLVQEPRPDAVTLDGLRTPAFKTLRSARARAELGARRRESILAPAHRAARSSRLAPGTQASGGSLLNGELPGDQAPP